MNPNRNNPESNEELLRADEDLIGEGLDNPDMGDGLDFNILDEEEREESARQGFIRHLKGAEPVTRTGFGTNSVITYVEEAAHDNQWNS